MNTEYLAGCVILEEGKILLVNEKKDRYWKIPSGKIDPGETPDQTAIRETMEETGLEVRLIKNLGEHYFKFKGRDFNMTYYLAEIIGGELQNKERANETVEHAEFKPVREMKNTMPSNDILYDILKLNKLT